MKRNTKRMVMAFGLLFGVSLGLVILVGALGAKIARWGGYADALPLAALLILFVGGQVIVSATRPSRKARY